MNRADELVAFCQGIRKYVAHLHQVVLGNRARLEALEKHVAQLHRDVMRLERSTRSARPGWEDTGLGTRADDTWIDVTLEDLE